MPKPRKYQISLEATPYCHSALASCVALHPTSMLSCISRCVRRAFQYGREEQTGRSFEHRRGWIENRLLALGQIFAVDIVPYAVMSNHIHLVVRLNKKGTDDWSPLEVIERGHRLFSGTSLSKRALRGEVLSAFEQSILDVVVALWRSS